MTPRSAAWLPKLRHLSWLAVLAGVIVFIGIDASRRSAHIRELTARYGVAVDAPAVDPSSLTGYAHGVRSLVLPSRGMDGYHWIMQTQQAVAHGEWRVRHVDYDGGPSGREVHWAMPFRLYVTLLAWCDHALRGAPWGVAVEHAAVWSGPLLLILALAVGVPWMARRFSATATVLCALGAVAAFPFYVDFVAGYTDHHGLVNLCALVCVLALVASGTDLTRAKRRVVASGIAGGLGLWISTATQVPVLIGIGLGAVLLLWRERRLPTPSLWSTSPELFRRWGIAGAATAVLAYAAEYFPAEMSLRLEVNHPLYALAWLGAGEALCRLARVLRPAAGMTRRADLLGGLFSLALVAVLPAVIGFAPKTFQVLDPFLWRLHHDFIAEFETMTDFLRQGGYAWSALAHVLPLLGLLPAAWLVWRGDVTAEHRARLTLALAPAAFAAAMAWNQVRWWGLAIALLAPLTAAVFSAPEKGRARSRRRERLALLAGGLLLAPGLIAAIRHSADADAIVDDDVQALAERDVAQWLRQRAGDEPVVVAASPTVSTALVFFGGVRGVGTLYWENNAGLHAAARLYGARDEATARALARDNLITHLVVVTWDGFEGIYTRLIRKLPAEAPIPDDAFIAQLLRAPVPPPWLRAVPFPLPPHPALRGAQIRIYEVVAEQSAAEAVVHAADAALELNDAAALARLSPLLGEYPADLRAACARARICFHDNAAAAFAGEMDRITAAVSLATALPLEDHVHLVTALAMAQRFDLASGELQSALRKANEATLRRLSTGTLVELLSLSVAANQPWPDAARQAFALKQVPPARRAQLTASRPE